MARIADVIEGLQILAKYTDPEAHSVKAKRCVVYAGPDGGVVSSEDAARLHKLGWFLDGQVGAWARYV